MYDFHQIAHKCLYGMLLHLKYENGILTNFCRLGGKSYDAFLLLEHFNYFLWRWFNYFFLNEHDYGCDLIFLCLFLRVFACHSSICMFFTFSINDSRMFFCRQIESRTI